MKFTIKSYGGPGSGNIGHKGLKDVHGGSLPAAKPTALEVLQLSNKEISIKYPEYYKKIQLEKQKRIIKEKEISKSIEIEKEEIKVLEREYKDWATRKYKPSEKTITTGRRIDDAVLGTKRTIGEINEKRRQNTLISITAQIKEKQKKLNLLETQAKI